MNSIKDLLLSKASDIDESGIKTDLELIQAELDRYFEGEVTIYKITSGKATILTNSAPHASNFRMKQHQLLEDLNSSLQNKLSQFIIRIA